MCWLRGYLREVFFRFRSFDVRVDRYFKNGKCCDIRNTTNDLKADDGYDDFWY